MYSLDERRKFAQVHVEFGSFLITRQREMVERHKSEGRDSAPAQNLLVVLERTQQVLERDLARQLGDPTTDIKILPLEPELPPPSSDF
jgi:hypothetical protein